jgi:hypothetical protein
LDIFNIVRHEHTFSQSVRNCTQDEGEPLRAGSLANLALLYISADNYCQAATFVLAITAKPFADMIDFNIGNLVM